MLIAISRQITHYFVQLIHNIMPTMANHAQPHSSNIDFDFARPITVKSQQLQLQ